MGRSSRARLDIATGSRYFQARDSAPMHGMNAALLLEDGTLFRGLSFGAVGEAFGEVVFNTSITGYQEILTDPSYKGQIVTMTYPLIGNCGVNPEDTESRRLWLEGFVVREASQTRSNWRSTKDLGTYLAENSVVGIQGIDTRALTRHIRVNGSKQAVISSVDADPASLARKLSHAPRIEGADLVREVTCAEPYQWTEGLPHAAVPMPLFNVVILDCGVKRNILRSLVSSGCRVTVVPATTDAREILEMNPDGLLISNGPGDPEPVGYAIECAAGLMGKLPIFGICLGQQILGLALGGKKYKLKFGHHGGNHPVKDIDSGRISITSQNHNFNIDTSGIRGGGTRMTHVNLFDKTEEGMENPALRLFSVQYHPEAGPGPHDSAYLFRKFTGMMERRD
jgi:carbamoyl-phosphate synthase small subunit